MELFTLIHDPQISNQIDAAADDNDKDDWRYEL